MSPHRNGRHSLIKSHLPEQALALPRILSEAVSKRSSASETASGVARVNMLLCNAYLVGEPHAGDRDWVLVDAGIVLGASAIIRAAEDRFGPESRPAAIVLTHGHFDHVGGLPQLADYWDAPIYCHRLEMPYLTGRSSYPPPDPSAGGGAMTQLSRLFPRGPYDFQPRVAPLPNDGTIPGLTDWRWIHTPGHTPGHVSLWRQSDRTLIAGDAFVTTRQESATSILISLLTQHAVVSRPPAYYTPDWASARQSIEQLANLNPETALTGHGPSMHGDELRRGLANLLQHWDEAVVPAGGRYSEEPAVADEAGVRSIPPASKKQYLQTAAGVGLAAIVVGWLLKRKS